MFELITLVLILLAVPAALLLVFRLRRASTPAQPREPISARQRLVRLLRLARVGFGALGLVLAVLIVYEDYRTMKAETAPAFQSVSLPPDLSFAVEEVTFSGADGVRLAGWYVPPANGVTIILLHGYGGTRASMLWHAETLVRAGYGVLMYDERASGESGGLRRSYGWEDGPDVGSAVAFIQSHNGGEAAQIGIGGCSVGGQIALQGAIGSPQIAAVWADGPSNLRAVDNPPPQNVLTGLVLVSNYLLDFLYQQELGIPAPPPMIDQIQRIAPRPLMLVGGGKEVGLLGSEAARVEHYAK